MIRVVVAAKGPPARGGIPTFVDWMLRSELAATHELTLVNFTDSGPLEGGRLSRRNVGRVGRDAAVLFDAAGAADVVHIHSALAPLVTLIRVCLLALVARVRGCPVIVHAHGGRFRHWVEHPLRRAVVRAALAPASRVVSVSQSGYQALAPAVPHGRLRLIENGIDLDVFRPSDRGARIPRIVFVGSLTPRKGVIDLIRACVLLRGRGVEHELWIVGGSPDEGAAAEAEVREAATGVRLLGHLPPTALPELYAETDIFCLPSWWEAMPLSVLEAMASGLPVVATNVGDIPRVVVDGECGYIVPPRDVERLATALERLAVDPALRQRFGATGRRMAETRFSAQATAAALAAVYAEVTA